MRDKFLTEAMGLEWHEARPSGYVDYTECGPEVIKPCVCLRENCSIPKNRDFSEWKYFGILWEWAQEQEWWGKFKSQFFWTGLESLINPERFADAVYNFLVESTWPVKE